MKVAEIITWESTICIPTDTLNPAAQLMWASHCGSLPNVEQFQSYENGDCLGNLQGCLHSGRNPSSDTCGQRHVARNVHLSAK